MQNTYFMKRIRTNMSSKNLSGVNGGAWTQTSGLPLRSATFCSPQHGSFWCTRTRAHAWNEWQHREAETRRWQRKTRAAAHLSLLLELTWPSCPPVTWLRNLSNPKVLSVCECVCVAAPVQSSERQEGCSDCAIPQLWLLQRLVEKARSPAASVQGKHGEKEADRSRTKRGRDGTSSHSMLPAVRRISESHYGGLSNQHQRIFHWRPSAALSASFLSRWLHCA